MSHHTQTTIRRPRGGIDDQLQGPPPRPQRRLSVEDLRRRYGIQPADPDTTIPGTNAKEGQR